MRKSFKRTVPMITVDSLFSVCAFRRRSLVVALAFLCFGSCSLAADWTLQELMGVLAQQRSGKANFVEKKYLSVLDQPLESAGELSYVAPDRLEKRTTKPRQESMLLEGDNLTVQQPGKRVLRLRLQDHAAIAATVESIRGTLAGDLESLEKNYAVNLSGNPHKWQLSLVPVNDAVARIVRFVHITGMDANINTIRFEQTDGDRSEMTISKISRP